MAAASSADPVAAFILIYCCWSKWRAREADAGSVMGAGGAGRTAMLRAPFRSWFGVTAACTRRYAQNPPRAQHGSG